MTCNKQSELNAIVSPLCPAASGKACRKQIETKDDQSTGHTKWLTLHSRAPTHQELQFPLTNLSQTRRRNAAGPLSSDCPQLLQSEPAELKYIEAKPQTTLVADWTPWKGKMACNKQTLNSLLHKEFGIDDWAVLGPQSPHCVQLLQGKPGESRKRPKHRPHQVANPTHFQTQ